ncbi:hypothetical protein OXYTRIMIC_559 [Oxytricha trifallax]|uniref:Uncharacterized protein n=1 Tax=Oxytricha trifallax TaxID=1172189 RepID=A0A073HYH7_9SPIT|nr:hypothetical protein OXYTRIMIC_559 [Oxytricha trifallax]
MLHLIYKSKQYAEQVIFWKDFVNLAQEQLKLPDLQNNKFQLPPLRFNPTNYYSNQHTWNQVKKQKKRAAKKTLKLNEESESETDTSPQKPQNSGKSSTPTRGKQQQEAQNANKRQKR